MKKLPNWEIEFDTFQNRKLNTPFKWGSWDCVMFTNAFIKVMTKKDLLPKEWNWLAMEYEEENGINLIHYTIGTPCFKEYENTSLSFHWKKYFINSLKGHFNRDKLK